MKITRGLLLFSSFLLVACGGKPSVAGKAVISLTKDNFETYVAIKAVTDTYYDARPKCITFFNFEGSDHYYFDNCEVTYKFFENDEATQIAKLNASGDGQTVMHTFDIRFYDVQLVIVSVSGSVYLA